MKNARREDHAFFARLLEVRAIMYPLVERNRVSGAMHLGNDFNANVMLLEEHSAQFALFELSERSEASWFGSQVCMKPIWY